MYGAETYVRVSSSESINAAQLNVYRWESGVVVRGTYVVLKSGPFVIFRLLSIH
jgi:hypothetical protein